MKLDIIKIAKEVFKDKELILEDVGKDKVKINYVAKRGNYNRKPFIFPKEILIDEGFIEGLALFLGDGDFHRKEKANATFASKDKDIIIHFLKFLRTYFLLTDADFSVSIRYKTKNDDLAKQWAKIIECPWTKIRSAYSDRAKEEACHIQVNGVIFRKIFEECLSKICRSNFLMNLRLRRAFLRGIFAAEGSVGIDYKEKKPYISQITFSISLKEHELLRLICTALDSEGMPYRTDLGLKDNSVDIVITNWANYLKFWNVKMFDLCQRKKEKFFGIAKNLDIYFDFREDFRPNFFESLNMMQREIAEKIDSWQANVCRTIDGTHLLRVEQVMQLLPYSSYSKKEVIQNIEEIRIGSLTRIKPTSETVAFLKEFKSI